MRKLPFITRADRWQSRSAAIAAEASNTRSPTRRPTRTAKAQADLIIEKSSKRQKMSLLVAVSLASLPMNVYCSAASRAEVGPMRPSQLHLLSHLNNCLAGCCHCLSFILISVSLLSILFRVIASRGISSTHKWEQKNIKRENK